MFFQKKRSDLYDRCTHKANLKETGGIDEWKPKLTRFVHRTLTLAT